MSTNETRSDEIVSCYTTISLGCSRSSLNDRGSTIDWLIDQKMFKELKGEKLQEFLDRLTDLTETHGDALRARFSSSSVALMIMSFGDTIEAAEKATNTLLTF